MDRFVPLTGSRVSPRALLLLGLVVVAGFAATAHANHPVLVEGNCDSPSVGTTIVTAGTCGDFDGDGRIGTAEDTDGADRTFGTLRAALSNGAGAAAGTGINYNGTINIVTSGKFAEQLILGDDPATGGVEVLQHVTIQAAPGVLAMIDAVLSGDPAGGNPTRLNGTGIVVNAPTVNSRVVLRNLVVRNFSTGLSIENNSRVTIENCVFQNNRNYGIRVLGASRLAVHGSSVLDTGFRESSEADAATPGHGISFEDSSAGTVAKSLVTGNAASGLVNSSSLGTNAVRYYELVTAFNGTGSVVNAIRFADF